MFDEVDADKSSDNPALAHSFCLHLPFGTCCKKSSRKYSAFNILPSIRTTHPCSVVSSLANVPNAVDGGMQTIVLVN